MSGRVLPSTVPYPLATLMPLTSLAAVCYPSRMLAQDYPALDETIRRSAAKMFRRLPRGKVEFSDLVSAGWIGVLMAQRTFLHSRGVHLGAYAARAIEGEMCRTVYPHRHHPELETVSLDGLPLDRLASNVPGPEAVAEAKQQSQHVRDLVRSAIDRLPDVESKVIRQHHLERRGLADIGRELGVSRQRISQIHRRAFRRLKGKIGEGAAGAIAPSRSSA